MICGDIVINKTVERIFGDDSESRWNTCRERWITREIVVCCKNNGVGARNQIYSTIAGDTPLLVLQSGILPMANNAYMYRLVLYLKPIKSTHH